MDKIIEYFANDPLKFLYLIVGGTGGIGGIWYWINQWRDRIRIQVRILNETYDVKEETYMEVKIEFEIENMGDRVTSLERIVHVSGYTPEKEYEKFSFVINNLERKLPPLDPKKFNAVFKVPAKYPFLLFRTYTFRPTRGTGKRLRVWSASKRNITFIRFYCELLRFKLFGPYKEPQAKEGDSGFNGG